MESEIAVVVGEVEARHGGGEEEVSLSGFLGWKMFLGSLRAHAIAK